MALLHRATLVPSKSDLVAAWLPGRPWAPGAPTRSGVSYRLDDPAGEVGLEGFVLTDADGHTVHVPLTYRAQPLEGAEEHLLGTMEHSVLGTRWAYDGCHDPVFVAALAATIATGGTQADELVDVGGTLERREPKVRLQGSGEPGTALAAVGDPQVREDATAATISCGFGELVVVRRVGADPGCDHTVTATWEGRPSGALLAGLRLR
jgi:hypothetical protein